MSERVSPAQRKAINHMKETGGYIPGTDPIKIHPATLERMLEKGLVKVERARMGSCWTLTSRGIET